MCTEYRRILPMIITMGEMEGIQAACLTSCGVLPSDTQYCSLAYAAVSTEAIAAALHQNLAIICLAEMRYFSAGASTTKISTISDNLELRGPWTPS